MAGSPENPMTDDEPTVHAVSLDEPDSVDRMFGSLIEILVTHGHSRADIAASLLCLFLDVCEDATSPEATEKHAPISLSRALDCRRKQRTAQRAGAN